MEKKKCPGVAAGARQSKNADDKSATNKRTMAATQEAPVYVLRLRSPRGDDIRRLRLLLKLLLRSYGLRCLSVEQEPQQ